MSFIYSCSGILSIIGALLPKRFERRIHIRIEKRSIPPYIILSLVTCGIFGLFWMATLNDDVNAVLGHTDDTSGGLVVLLGIVTCGIYAIYWNYKIGSKLDEALTTQGMASKNLGILSVLGLGGAYAIFALTTGFYIPCPFRAATGLLCPGCGISHCASRS